MADHEMKISRMESCGGCNLKCLGAHPSSRALTSASSLSFYKVMAADFSFELELPLEIATRMKSRARTDVILIGPSGHLWHVSFRCTDTSGSFRDGWKRFVCDNGIVERAILVFRHVVDMHFVVQVFEASHCGKDCTLQSHTSCCCGEGILSELFRQKSSKPRKALTKVSGAPVIFVVEQGKYKDTELKKQICLDCRKTTRSCEATLSYEDIRKMLCNTENSISQNQIPIFLKHPGRLAAGLKVTSCPVTNDDPEAPRFSVTMQKSAIHCNFWMSVPKVFADRWLPKRNTEVILLHYRNPGIWPVTFKRNRNGWACKNFIVSNNIRRGDKCAFELIKSMKQIVFKVYVMS